MKKRPAISVIVPVANEAAALPECLARIGGVPNEIIIVDAESDDATAATARQFGCRLLSFPEGHRARQMNLGGAEARAPILLFLHADTLLPAGALEKIVEEINRRSAVGGGFARRYRSRSLTLAITTRLAQVRSRLFGWHLGDQALFVRRDVFWKIAGLLRLSPLIPLNASNYFYGVTSIGFWLNVLASFFGMLPGTLLYAYLGAVGQAALGGGKKGDSPLEWTFLAIGLLAPIG